MKKYILINNENDIIGSIEFHDDTSSIEDLTLEKEETDRIVEISDELYVKYNELNNNKKDLDKLHYLEDSKDIILNNPLELKE